MTTRGDADDARYDLERFVTAQDRGGAYDAAYAELRRGRKTSHWMWFVFPQVKGLGMSSTARFYGIDGLGEATAYLAHPVLGPRLRAAAQAVREAPGSAQDVLGGIDAMKLRSSMTLFLHAAQGAGADADAELFRSVLDRYYDGAEDTETLHRI